MALTKCNVPSNVIGSLATRAEERGLTAQEFKDKFDEMPEGIKQYINDVLTVEIDAHMAENVTQGDIPHGIVYEEGEWTPYIYGLTVAGDNSYTTQFGRYIRKNNEITAWANIFLSAKDANMEGAVRVGGLPFQSLNISGYVASASIGILRNVTWGTNSVLVGNIAHNRNFIELFVCANGGVNAALQPTALNDTSLLQISVTYRIKEG